MAQLAADVSHLLDRKGIASAALAGLSMGGLVVMELAAAQPERWWAYGFIATTAQRLTGEERAARLDSARTMEEQGMGPVAGQMGARLFGPQAQRAADRDDHGHDAGHQPGRRRGRGARTDQTA